MPNPQHEVGLEGCDSAFSESLADDVPGLADAIMATDLRYGQL